MNLKERFEHNCYPFTQDQNLINKLWSEIETKYKEKGRFYHNLEHLKVMFYELDNVKSNITNYTNVSFSVFYHDIIYNILLKSNEEKSSVFAKHALKVLKLKEPDLSTISDQILATKKHDKSDNNDINYLIDADLSVLGKDSDTYSNYIKSIRAEYSIYPDLLFRNGRKKVLRYFLQQKNIFKTEYFIEKYEEQAKKNILSELSILQG